MKNKYMIIAILAAVCCAAAIVYALRWRMEEELPQKPTAVRRIATRKRQAPEKKPENKKPEEKKEPTTPPFINGTVTDTEGNPMAGVVVSNGIDCSATDSLGRYKLPNDSTARFVFFTVPADCEVPVHSAKDHTAHFYKPIIKGVTRYSFTLKKLAGGVEKYYKMIVLGDPQVTNDFNPYYNGPDDKPLEIGDVERFATETMADIRRTIRSLPQETPIYGLSMGDDVQYYGGFNPMLEQQIREVLGSSKMRIFSVIGNHDQDNNPEYLNKWEEAWGPTDYSFDRGNEHYVCFNNVRFHGKYASYYSPGELSDSQMKWLQQDLALTPKSKKVVLCYHIPFTFGTSPFGKARPLSAAHEKGHYSSSRLPALLSLLSEFSGGYELFCGHTHFAINHETEIDGHHVIEHCHAAACGNIWQSNINICGTPNGYYVYTFRGGRMVSCYYKGTFWDAHKQMTLFHADTDFNGESYAADWDLPRDRRIIVANVFNADSHWRITAEENGVEYPMQRINSKGQDAFATGYHHKYAVATSFRFISKQNSYLIMNHLYYYEPKSAESKIRIIARDPYGHTFTEDAENIVTEPFFNYAHYYK